MNIFVRGGGSITNKPGGIDQSESIKDPRHLRLMALLDRVGARQGAAPGGGGPGRGPPEPHGQPGERLAVPADADGPEPGPAGRGRGLEWLRDEERFMPVELALLEEHGLTLSPQTNWRRQAMEDARRARRRRERLRWFAAGATDEAPAQVGSSERAGSIPVNNLPVGCCKGLCNGPRSVRRLNGFQAFPGFPAIETWGRLPRARV